VGTSHPSQGGCPSAWAEGRATMGDSGHVDSSRCCGPTSTECWLLFWVLVCSHACCGRRATVLRALLSPRGTREHHRLHAAPWAQIRVLSGRAGTSWAPDSRPLRVLSRSPLYPGPPFPLTLPPLPGCGHEQADQRCLKLWALLSLQLGPSILQRPSGWDGAQARITANPALRPGGLTPRGGRGKGSPPVTMSHLHKPR